MKRDLRFEAVYPYSLERVWRALTDREELAQWLMSNDFAPRLGQSFQFSGKPRPGFDGIVRCQVIEIEAPRLLAYRWVTGHLATVLRFSLEPASEGGTRLILEHSGFEGGGGLMMSALLGWNRMLREKLPSVISGTPLATVQCNVDILSALIDRYERGESAFSDLIRRFPAELRDSGAAETKWSARQTAIHIVDAEIVGAMRLRMIAAQPGSTLPSYAGDIWARELRYTNQPLEPSLDLFQALRQATTAMLRQLPLSAWSNRAEHEEAGEVTLESYLDSHCEHAESHMEEIESLLNKLTKVPVASDV
jgi:uncharacterized protein YndB with AHSA1/START domain